VIETTIDTVKMVATKAVQGAADLGKRIGEGVVETVNAIGEAVVAVQSAIHGAYYAFCDWLYTTFGCMAFGVVNGIGYGKKVPCPMPLLSLICPQPTNVACTILFGVAFTLAMTFDVTNMLRGVAVYGVAITITIVFGMVPGGNTGFGGLRVGLGVAAGLLCPPNEQISGSSNFGDCLLQINVGAVASAVIPLPINVTSPRCVLGYCVLGFNCSESFGVVYKILCCQIRLTDGCGDCSDSGKCNPSETKRLPPIPDPGMRETPEQRRKLDAKLDKLTSSGESSCDETLKGRGFNYRGCIARTSAGIECQMWTSQFPHQHGLKWAATNWGRCNVQDKQECTKAQRGLGNHNQCRNPRNNMNTIWCFTKDPNKRWDYCSAMTEIVAGMTKVAPNVFVRKNKRGEDYKRSVYVLFGGRFQRFCTFSDDRMGGGYTGRIFCNNNFIGHWEKFGVEKAELSQVQDYIQCYQTDFICYIHKCSYCQRVWNNVKAGPNGGKVDRRMFAARSRFDRYSDTYWSNDPSAPRPSQYSSGQYLIGNAHDVKSAWEQFRVGPPAAKPNGKPVDQCYKNDYQSYACLGKGSFSIQNVKSGLYCKDYGDNLKCEQTTAHSSWFTFRTRRVGYKLETPVRSPGGHKYPIFTTKKGQWLGSSMFGQKGYSRF